MTDIDAVAAAIANAQGNPTYWDCISEVTRDHYRRMAQAAIDALGLTEERRAVVETNGNWPPVATGTSALPPQQWVTFTRLTSPWMQAHA